MTNKMKTEYLKTIFQFKNLINTEFSRGKKQVLRLTDLLIMQGIMAGQSSSEIASDLRLTKAAVSQSVTALVKKKFIIRAIDPENRRHLSLALTPAGKEQLMITNAEFDTAFEAFVHEMGAADLKQLLTLMQKMTTLIEK